MAKMYMGFRRNHVQQVFVTGPTGVKEPLDPRTDLWNHSPDGFNWGYGGSGPAQLALAILADATHSDETAVQLHQDYKWEVIARLKENDILIFESHVLDWVSVARAKTSTRDASMN